MNIAAKEGPYAGLIKQFIISQFPNNAKNIGHDDLIDLLTNIIVGSTKYRYGPRPTPEALVNIRKVIRDCVAANRPIPFMAPWGSVKTTRSALNCGPGVRLLRV